jgi:putative tryptophan/tyrosine transport system ATP-binding protein
MITVEGLSVRFNPGTPLERHALRGMSLTVEDKEFCCVIGSNGAGKSTLLSAVAGDVLPEAGRVILSGRDVTRQPAERRARLVARVFQDPLAGSCGRLTIAENLAIAARRGKWRGFGDALARHRMRTVFERVAELDIGLEKRLDQPMGSLSGGQRQALALSMATLLPPKLLLLDEHTAALDPKTSQLVMDATVAMVQNANLTTLMVTHNMEHALSYASRIVMMNAGRIVADIGFDEKKGLTVQDLVARFHISDDRMILA